MHLANEDVNGSEISPLADRKISLLPWELHVKPIVGNKQTNPGIH